MDKLNPDALAPMEPDDDRPGVQDADADMIRSYILDSEELPSESAHAFTRYVYKSVFDYNENGDLTWRQVIESALEYWCGGRTK